MTPTSWLLRVTDALVLLAAGVLALSPLGDAYAGNRWIVAAVCGLLLGLGTTWLASSLSLGVLTSALLVALGYLLVAPGAAAPDQAVAGVLPSLDAEHTVVTGVVTSWRSTLTQPVPIGSTHGELVVPFTLALVMAAVAATFLWRSRWPAMAVVPVIGAFVGAAAFGDREAQLPLLRGGLLVVLVLVWLRWRALRGIKTVWPRRVALTVAVVAVAGAAGWGLSAAVGGPPERDVLRDHVAPPLHRLDFKSPLAGYRDFYKRLGADVLFTFEDVPKGDPRFRLATMDTYDGYVWNLSSRDLVTGTSSYRPAPPSSSGGALEVTVGAYDGPWLPTVGTATAASLANDDRQDGDRGVLINSSTGSLVVDGGVRKGDVYRVDWSPRTERDDGSATKVDHSYPVRPQGLPVIAKLDALAQQWVADSGARNEREIANALVDGFQRGYFSDGVNANKYGLSAPGHSAKRLADLAANPERMVGNDEQYAAAMAYEAQRMGMPARVVLGFPRIQPGDRVTGEDIGAWVEIPFEGQGWVSFDPTPPKDRILPRPQDAKDPLPQPYVVQPPLLPEEPDDGQGVPPSGSGKDLSSKLWGILWAVLGVAWQATKVALWLSPLWLILVFKRFRRRRRMRADDPLDRISGAWRELSDHARDLGARIPPGHTRHETGLVLAERFPQSEPTGLAGVADRHVFGPSAPTSEEVAAYWVDVESALKRMRSEVPWWRRALGCFSLASVPWRRALRRTRETSLVILRNLRGLVHRAMGRLSRRRAEQREST